METIKITCKGADTLPIDRILEFQGNLKKLTNTNRNRLKRSILRHGFTAPLFVWDDSGEWRLLDGHQRLATLISMRKEGYDIPLLPVDYIEAKDEKEAQGKLLNITSQYGEFDVQELNEWVSEVDAELTESLRFVDREIELGFVQDDDYGEDFTLQGGEKEPFQQMTFTLADEQAEYIRERLSDAKRQIDFDLMDCFGNENGNGNALYCLLKGFVDE